MYDAGAVPRITKEQASENALKVLPGKVTDVTQERKRGKTVWVIEIVADKDGSENDVLYRVQFENHGSGDSRLRRPRNASA